MKGGPTHSFVLWTAFTLIAIVVFTGIVYPWMLSVWYGGCWSDARSDLRSLGNEIEGAIRSPGSSTELRMSPGNCVAGVLFLNGKEDPTFSRFVQQECGEYDGYRSYIMMIPKEYPLTASGKSQVPESLKGKLEDLKDSMTTWDLIKLWIGDRLGRIPEVYCYELEHDFTMDTFKSLPKGFYSKWLDMENWNTGQSPYCMEAFYRGTTDQSYNYYLRTIDCPPGIFQEEGTAHA